MRNDRDSEESVVVALEEIAWTVPVSVCMANAITATRRLLLSLAGHPGRESGSCVSALPLCAIALRKWAGALSVSHGERDRCIEDGEQKDASGRRNEVLVGRWSPALATHERRHAPRIVSNTLALDLDDVGTVVGQHHCRVGARQWLVKSRTIRPSRAPAMSFLLQAPAKIVPTCERHWEASASIRQAPRSHSQRGVEEGGMMTRSLPGLTLGGERAANPAARRECRRR